MTANASASLIREDVANSLEIRGYQKSLLSSSRARRQQLECCCEDRPGPFRKLAQPFFLSLESVRGCTFAWLLLSLSVSSVSLFLFLTAGSAQLLCPIAPDSIRPRLCGVGWYGRWHVVILVAAVISILSFMLNAAKFRDHWSPWLLLGAALFMLFLENSLVVAFGFVTRDLTNAMVKRDEASYFGIIHIFVGIAIIAMLADPLHHYIVSRLGLNWRSWLTNSFITRYMGNRAYYQLNPNDEESQVDNPDQRIADDIREFTTHSLLTGLGLFNEFTKLTLNIAVLWSIDHFLALTLIVVSSLTTILTGCVLGKPLMRINFNQQRYEADFRYGLVHIRDNAESIAFYRGEKLEREEVSQRLGMAVGNHYLLIKWEFAVGICKRAYFYSLAFVPYAIMAPRFFAGESDYGSFTQAKLAFTMVEVAMSYFITHINSLAKFAAEIKRLHDFQTKVDSVNRTNLELAAVAVVSEAANASQASGIHVLGAELRTPGSSQALVRDLSFSVTHGQRLLIVGPSGCGKTSLLRMISGLWQPSTGTVERPPSGRLLFIPQRPYMLLGTLKEQLCYPLDPSDFTETQLREALHQVNLDTLSKRYPDLCVKQDWPRLLSLGEQQRLAFARLLLNSPEYVVLDEATSALDVTTERKLYGLLEQRCSSCVSVGHRPSLLPFHTDVLELQGHGNWRLIPAASYSFNVD